MEEAQMTLRRLCETLDISRRTVQGYETHGLVHATGRNDRGYLLYSQEAMEQIRLCRQYQQFGFPVKDIGLLLTLTGGEKRRRLEKQLAILERKQEVLNQNIQLLRKEINAEKQEENRT